MGVYLKSLSFALLYISTYSRKHPEYVSPILAFYGTSLCCFGTLIYLNRFSFIVGNRERLNDRSNIFLEPLGPPLTILMGVYLKYYSLSALSFALLYSRKHPEYVAPLLAFYGTSLCCFGTLIYLNRFSFVVGKDSTTGRIPFWSYLIHSPFHSANHLNVWLMSHWRKRSPSGSRVSDSIWLGGKRAREIELLVGEGFKKWDAVVDLTNEFEEMAVVDRGDYLNVPTWDGNPPTPEMIEMAVRFVEERTGENKRVLIHCAHGIGRSTLVTCACLIRLGVAKDAEEALLVVKAKRPIVKLNTRMKRILQVWDEKYN